MTNSEKPTGKLRNFQQFCVDFTLTAGGIAAIGGAVWTVFFRDSPSQAATCMAGGVVLLFAATIHRFEFLKGFGIEAKVKKLDETIDKAEVALEKLRQVGEVTSANIVVLSSTSGRLGVAPTLEKARMLASDIRRTLEGLGSSEETIRAALAPWVKIEAGDLARSAIKNVDLLLQTKAQSLQMQLRREEQVQDGGTRLNKLYAHTKPFSRKVPQVPPEKLPELLRECVSTAPELSVLEKEVFIEHLQPFCEEILHLAANYEFRNFQFWLNNLPDRAEASLD